MSLVRKMMRHGKVVIAPGVSVPRDRPKAEKKGTAFRRHLKHPRLEDATVHATKGRVTQ